jgi:hypothetical protein
MNPNAISDSFCRNELLEYTVSICRCTTANGTLVEDIYEPPTVSPAPAGPPSKDGKSTTSMSSTIFFIHPMMLFWGVAAASILSLNHS